MPQPFQCFVCSKPIKTALPKMCDECKEKQGEIEKEDA